MPQSCSEVNTSASTSGAGKRFLHVYHPHCVGRQTPNEDGGGEQISVSFASPTSEQGCILHEASRALKPLFSNSASAEGRKSDVTPVCVQTSSPPKHTNTHINITCSLMASMMVQIAHYYHTIKMCCSLTEH